MGNSVSRSSVFRPGVSSMMPAELNFHTATQPQRFHDAEWAPLPVDTSSEFGDFESAGSEVALHVQDDKSGSAFTTHSAEQFDIAGSDTSSCCGSQSCYGGSWHDSDSCCSQFPVVVGINASLFEEQQAERAAWLERYTSVSDHRYNEVLQLQADDRWPLAAGLPTAAGSHEGDGW